MSVPCDEMKFLGKLTIHHVMCEPGDRVCRVRMVNGVRVVSMSGWGCFPWWKAERNPENSHGSWLVSALGEQRCSIPRWKERGSQSSRACSGRYPAGSSSQSAPDKICDSVPALPVTFKLRLTSRAPTSERSRQSLVQVSTIRVWLSDAFVRSTERHVVLVQQNDKMSPVQVEYDESGNMTGLDPMETRITVGLLGLPRGCCLHRWWNGCMFCFPDFWLSLLWFLPYV